MKAVVKRFAALMLCMVMVLAGITWQGVVDVKADDTMSGLAYMSTTWDLYESSYYQYCNTKLGGNLVSSFSVSNDESSKPNVMDNPSGHDFYTPDGKMVVRFDLDGGACKLSSVAYSGAASTLDIRIPDSVTFHFVGEQKSQDEQTAMTVHATDPIYVTNIGSTFSGSNYITKNTNTFLNLVIPERVTTLEGNAFASNTKLKSVVFEGAIQTMGGGVFSGCNNLTTLDLTNLYTAMNTIPENSFYQCSSLENIAIPNTILNIGSNAFYQCDKIDYLVLTDNIKSIGSGAFAMCSNLRYIYVTSDYQDWNSIVDSTEVGKIVTTKTVAVNKDMNSLSSVGGLYGGRYYVHSGIDMQECTVKVNGNKVSTTVYTNPKTKVKGYSFKCGSKGTYKISGKDVAGNKINVSLRYTSNTEDKTAPVITYAGKVIKGEKYVNTKSKLKFADNGSGLRLVKYGSKKETFSGRKGYSTTLTKDGKYKLKAVDMSGNTLEATLYLDTVAPKVIGIKTGKAYKSFVRYTIKDAKGIKSYRYDGVEKLSAEEIGTKEKLLEVYDVGVHTIIITDLAGNKTVVTFQIRE